MNYLATFYTHYGAMLFHKHCKKENIRSKLAPVPRELSSSCGVCVKFESDSPPSSEQEDMERCYVVSNENKYEPLYAPEHEE
ncbi:MAG: DUF3343 domain-containing protein [Oscillospiraceae bacterium]|nr:DUF3343 domain-containing protein [Oscillospiraceae bacterium]